MSTTSIPNKVKFQLWALSGGRCELCNELLSESIFQTKRYNGSVMAHIVADSVDGPRGDRGLSPRLADKLENIMLVCPNCHKIIDSSENLDIFTVEVLQQKKAIHENRIKQQTAITDDLSCKVITYYPQVGQIPNMFTKGSIRSALVLDYRVEEPIIELHTKNGLIKENEDVYYTIEKTHLERAFRERILPLLSQDAINKFAIFAMAPMPLLILLGKLVSDKMSVDVFQRRRSTQNWIYDSSELSDYKYNIIRPTDTTHKNVALNLSLSADIHNDRIMTTLGADTSIWTIQSEQRFNDFVTHKKHVELFSIKIRELLNEIKYVHGQNTELYVFMAIPLSIAIEFGRVWMPKADMKLHLYDQLPQIGFKFALTLE